MADLPLLPHGSPSILSGLSESFSFHSSPESFITSRVLDFQSNNPGLADLRIPIRAKILNRNIAIISSYAQIKQVLCDNNVAEKLSSRLAYDELMAPFFPPPNLLLCDPPDHAKWKAVWMERMKTITSDVIARVPDIVRRHFHDKGTEQTVDLYETMKDLSSKLLLNAFLTTATAGPANAKVFAKVSKLQEELLHGQFSLFPVSVNLGMWTSPRSKGIAARKKLQTLFREYVNQPVSDCPFRPSDDEELEEIVNHLVLFTSSLAVKALASLLTATLLNLYTEKKPGEGNLVDRIRGVSDGAKRLELITQVVQDTEWNSPPVVGVMRRATSDIVLGPATAGQNATLIPKGWDVWLYFVGAVQDPTSSYGKDISTTDGESMGNQRPREGLTFGIGSKQCLGSDILHQILIEVVKTLIGVELNGAITSTLPIRMGGYTIPHIPKGVQAWLGWIKNVTPDEWAADMKQLPVQRPVKPIKVTITGGDPTSQVVSR